MKENGILALKNNMEEAFVFGLTAPNKKVSGKTAKQMVIVTF
jgi:hypothetical protein